MHIFTLHAHHSKPARICRMKKHFACVMKQEMGTLLHGFWPDVTGDLKPTSPQDEGAKWLSDFTCLLTDTQKLLYTQGGVTFSCEQADPFLLTFPTAKAFIKQAIDVTFDLQWLVLSRCQELMEVRVDIWALLMYIDSTAYIEKVIRRAKSRGSKGERESVTSLLWASERELILELVVLVRAHTVRIYWLIAQSLFISSSSLGLHPQFLSPSFPCTHVLTYPFIHLPQFLDGFFILLSFLLFLTVSLQTHSDAHTEADVNLSGRFLYVKHWPSHILLLKRKNEWIAKLQFEWSCVSERVGGWQQLQNRIVTADQLSISARIN